MEDKNPYSTMIKLMQNHGAKLNPPSIQLGQVISSTPLAIGTSDIQLNSNNLLIPDYLLDNYSRKVTIDNGTEVEIKTKDKLSVGDTVAMVQISDSNFLILCKVVKL